MTGDKAQILRHFLAALAYRTQKALRGCPESFGGFRVAPGVRTPHELVFHMTTVLRYACSRFDGEPHQTNLQPTFAAEIEGYHRMLGDLSELIATGEPTDTTAEQILQGPLADAMTHAGQLALLRRLAGSPVPPESFLSADIDAENVGSNQPDPARPLERWQPAEDEPW